MIPKVPSLSPVQSEGDLHHPSSGSGVLLDMEQQSTETTSEPPCKKLRLEVCDTKLPYTNEKSSYSALLAPGSSCDVVAMTTLPEFVGGAEACLQLVVEWVSHMSSDTKDGSKDWRKKRRFLPCGRVVLTATDVARGDLGVQMPCATPDSGG